MHLSSPTAVSVDENKLMNCWVRKICCFNEIRVPNGAYNRRAVCATDRMTQLDAVIVCSLSCVATC